MAGASASQRCKGKVTSKLLQELETGKSDEHTNKVCRVTPNLSHNQKWNVHVSVLVRHALTLFLVSCIRASVSYTLQRGMIDSNQQQ